MSAASALQKAIHERLSGDATLTDLLGADGICDHMLDKRLLPLLVFEAIESRDLSTSTELGEEHFLTLTAWSDQGGHREVQRIAAQVRRLVDGAELPLDGFHLVSVLHRATKIGREKTKPFHKAEIRFRAVTE